MNTGTGIDTTARAPPSPSLPARAPFRLGPVSCIRCRDHLSLREGFPEAIIVRSFEIHPREADLFAVIERRRYTSPSASPMPARGRRRSLKDLVDRRDIVARTREALAAGAPVVVVFRRLTPPAPSSSRLRPARAGSSAASTTRRRRRRPRLRATTRSPSPSAAAAARSTAASSSSATRRRPSFALLELMGRCVHAGAILAFRWLSSGPWNSKAALRRHAPRCPYANLSGRRGGSAHGGRRPQPPSPAAR